jgi:hypothetical protein
MRKKRRVRGVIVGLPASVAAWFDRGSVEEPWWGRLDARLKPRAS